MIEQKFEVSNLITPLINAYKALNNEWKNLIASGLNDYLHSQTEKYYFTNTFLHRSEKVVFNEIYFPIKANYKQLTTDFSDIHSIFENYKNITLIGSAGSGKTTLVKYIFLHSIELRGKIPIIIELRNLNDNKASLQDLITEKIIKTRIKPSDGILNRALESGKFLFLFDGYDEIFSTRKKNIIEEIDSFVDAYSNNNYIITTRPGSGIEGFPRFYDFRVCELSDNDVVRFVKKLVEDPDRCSRITKIIEDPKNSDYNEYLRNPLLLSMFIMAFESHPEIPSRKSAFYRNVFDTLFSKHDGITKNSFPREKLTGLEREDFEKILNVFSFITFSNGVFGFTEEYLLDLINKLKKALNYSFNSSNLIKDLHTTISIFLLDGFEYKFPHRSMQEYFAARFLSELSDTKQRDGYKKLIRNFKKLSNDNSLHFWTLCQELDSDGFISNYILPELKILQKKMLKPDDDSLVETYLKTLRYLIYFERENKVEVKSSLARYTSHESQLLVFLDILQFNKMGDFFNEKEAMSKILSYSNITIDKFSMTMELDDEIIKILKKYDFVNFVKDQNKLIDIKINELSEQLKNSDHSMDDIINLAI